MKCLLLAVCMAVASCTEIPTATIRPTDLANAPATTQSVDSVVQLQNTAMPDTVVGPTLGAGTVVLCEDTAAIESSVFVKYSGYVSDRPFEIDVPRGWAASGYRGVSFARPAPCSSDSTHPLPQEATVGIRDVTSETYLPGVSFGDPDVWESKLKEGFGGGVKVLERKEIDMFGIRGFTITVMPIAFGANPFAPGLSQFIHTHSVFKYDERIYDVWLTSPPSIESNSRKIYEYMLDSLLIGSP